MRGQRAEDRRQKTDKGQKTEHRAQSPDRKLCGSLSSVICHLSSAFCALSSVLCLLCSAPEAATITADSLEYIAKEDQYLASGKVRVEEEGAVLTADRVVLHQATSLAEAEGNVVYEDAETRAETDRAELDLKKRTGKLHDAVIFVKKGNYWITGEGMEKVKGDHYRAKKASFTTCDAEPGTHPDWCFKGNDVDVVVGERLFARDVTYRIKGLPVLYSPVLWAPVQKERSSGFLVPLIGNSSEKGFRLSPSYFWAIDENMDATFTLDYYSKRGLGMGAEYRYIAPASRGNWYGYYLRDRELDRDFLVLKGQQRHEAPGWEGKLDLNYVNDDAFYKEYGSSGDERIQRFLQSTGELSLPLRNSRLYLLTQYWVDLRDRAAFVPQRLPELGYTISPTDLGPFTFTLASGLTNFVREEGVRGQRLDILPTISHAFGDGVRLYQSLSLRETAYSLNDGGAFGRSPHRESFQYTANAQARFFKNYGAVTHAIVPSVGYTYMPGTESLPLFDSTEALDRTSVAQASLLSSWDSRDLSLSLRLTQPYNLDPRAGEPSLMPTRLEAAIRGAISFNLDLSHNFRDDRLETVNSNISARVADQTSISLGERYTRKDSIAQRYLWEMLSIIPEIGFADSEEVLFYTASVSSVLSKRWAFDASAWYNAAGGGLRDSTLKVTYTDQCWSLSTAFSRRPGDGNIPTDFSFMFYIELKGLGIVRLL